MKPIESTAQDTIKEASGVTMKAMFAVPSSSRESLLARLWRLSWLTFLVATCLLSATWWLMAPAGFGVGHSRFWANRVAPLVGLGLSLAGLGALRRESKRALRWVLLAWPAGSIGAVVSGRMLFPITLGQLWLSSLTGSVIMSLTLMPLWRGTNGRMLAGGLGMAFWAAMTGAALVWTQYPPTSRTRPSREDSVEAIPLQGTNATENPRIIHLASETVVDTFDGSLIVRPRPLSISVKPLLTFLSGSRDGSWSVFARPLDRVGPEPRLRYAQPEGNASWMFFYDFQAQGPATLRVQAEPTTGSIDLEANTTLTRAVYSHLNSYCDVEVRGHRRLELEFSPCPGVPIEVRKFDYPIGRPARFAFVQEDRTFRVVEATSGEKGPFRDLGRGRLGREETLTIGLRDQGQTIARVSLADWSAQLDTTISPTAGWGVPVNAIEFSLVDDAPSSPASIFVTLAATSVGRGWDCVAHNPGTYRNRIRVESVRDLPIEPPVATDRKD